MKVWHFTLILSIITTIVLYFTHILQDWKDIIAMIIMAWMVWGVIYRLTVFIGSWIKENF